MANRSDNQLPSVAVLDPDGPPGVAFIRSLGSRGVPVVAYGPTRGAAGKWSRHVTKRENGPGVHAGGEYLGWLTEKLRSGEITHIAPTSDYTVYAAAIAIERAGVGAGPGAVPLERAWSCLHKPTFDGAATAAGFDPVPGALPTSVDEAVAAADALGYPVVIKPRTHIGVGLDRGGIAHDADGLRAIFEPLAVDQSHTEALELDPDLAWPMMQRMVQSAELEVLSISGCIDSDQNVSCLGFTSKMAQWPPGMGIGSMFETRERDVNTDRALAVVAEALGTGLFELELVIDRVTGEAWPIDLNPRSYGQISLEIARGNDLPGAWYELATGHTLAPQVQRDPLPELWVSAMAHHPGALAGIVRGPDRRTRLSRFVRLSRTPHVGSVFERRDPLPAVMLSLLMLKHPGGLVRPFLQQR